MEAGRVLVDVGKFTCEKCGREIITHLCALPEHTITADVRKEYTKRSKEVHAEDCKGRSGITPTSYRPPRRRRPK